MKESEQEKPTSSEVNPGEFVESPLEQEIENQDNSREEAEEPLVGKDLSNEFNIAYLFKPYPLLIEYPGYSIYNSLESDRLIESDYEEFLKELRDLQEELLETKNQMKVNGEELIQIQERILKHGEKINEHVAEVENRSKELGTLRELIAESNKLITELDNEESNELTDKTISHPIFTTNPEPQTPLIKDVERQPEPSNLIYNLKALDVLVDFARLFKNPSTENAAILVKDVSFGFCYLGYKEVCIAPMLISAVTKPSGYLDWTVKLAQSLVYPLYNMGYGSIPVIAANTLPIAKELDHKQYLDAAIHFGIIGASIYDPSIGMKLFAVDYSVRNVYDFYMELSGEKSEFIKDEL